MITNLSAEELARRAAEIRWVLSDVDGVLTDGLLYYGRWGETLKTFHVHDGLGMKLAQRAGLKVGLLTARQSAVVKRRGSELGLDAVMDGERDKDAAFDRFLDRHQAAPRQIAYVGDDLPDLVVLSRAGLSFAPADAVAEVLSVAKIQLERAGGRGALREAIEILLRARGDWDQVLAPFTFDSP